MQKVILITGATDGIGLETSKSLLALGHHIIVHGRNSDKVASVVKRLQQSSSSTPIESIVADLSNLKSVTQMITEVAERFGKIDVLINNAGVYRSQNRLTVDELDVRFVVNTIAPYHLTKQLLPLLTTTGRVINLSSAAQAPVSISALKGEDRLSDAEAYAQSKLALTMWSRFLGLAHRNSGPMIMAVNPKSLLGSKMVRDAYGIAGGDLSLGAEVLVKASLSDQFSEAHGQYFDNDIEAFSKPHSQALNASDVDQVVATIEALIKKYA